MSRHPKLSCLGGSIGLDVVVPDDLLPLGNVGFAELPELFGAAPGQVSGLGGAGSRPVAWTLGKGVVHAENHGCRGAGGCHDTLLCHGFVVWQLGGRGNGRQVGEVNRIQQ